MSMEHRSHLKWTLAGKAAVGLVLLAAIMGTSAAQTVEYIHTDALGSPVATTDAAGNVISREVYEPYGAAINNGAADGPGFTGHVADSHTGLVYQLARFYDPDIGRFLSADPVGIAGGSNFNRYWYADNSPYTYIDPDGRRACGKNTTCALQQGATGGTMSMGHTDERNPDSPSTQAIANKASVEANKRLSDVKGKAFKSPGAAARAWANRVQPVADRYNAEIMSGIFDSGRDGAILGSAVSDGLIHQVTVATMNLSESPLGGAYAQLGYVHSHPDNTLLSNHDKEYGIGRYRSINANRARWRDFQVFVSRPDGRVFGWSVQEYKNESSYNKYEEF